MDFADVTIHKCLLYHLTSDQFSFWALFEICIFRIQTLSMLRYWQLNDFHHFGHCQKKNQRLSNSRFNIQKNIVIGKNQKLFEISWKLLILIVQRRWFTIMVLHIVSLTSTFADYFTFLLVVPYKGAQKHATHLSKFEPNKWVKTGSHFFFSDKKHSDGI